MGEIAGKRLVKGALSQGRRGLSEHEAKQVLVDYGIPVTQERLVQNADELREALCSFQLPVVLKVDSPDILHKTEAGLVELGCPSEEQALATLDRILTRAREHHPSAVINGVLVQEMVVGWVAECIVGVKRDAQFGPTILFGLGGIFVEVFGDVALRLAPLTPSEASAMIRETKGYKLLAGARGRPVADLRSIEQVLVKMSTLALDLEQYISEIDINPLMVLPQGAGAVAADALIVLDAPSS
jgi:acetate---CoA ligase (ADP-forming)